MAEVLLKFSAAVTGSDGRAYVARVCGREADDRLWEGWIEFEPREGGPVLRTPRESKQPNRADLEYWATGLTVAYLEGALARVRQPGTPDPPPPHAVERPTYDRPAPSPGEAERSGAAPRIRPRAVLDPFRAHAQGRDVLREELGALGEGHLRSIVRAYDLAGEAEPRLDALPRADLVELIVAEVRRRAG